MRHNRIIVCLVTLLLWVNLFAQREQVTIQVKNVSIPEILDQITEQSHFKFAYNTDLFTDQRASVDVTDASPEVVLGSIIPSNILIKKRGDYFIFIPNTEQNSKGSSVEIAGKVRDKESGKELSAVSVYEVSGLKASLTNEKGNYSLRTTIPDQPTFLMISKENYQDTVIRVEKNNPFFSVLLKPKSASEEQEKSFTFDSLKMFQWLSSRKFRTHTRNVRLEEQRLIHLGLVPGISTNGFTSGSIKNNISLNVVTGYAHSLEGVELGGVANFEREDVVGVQMAGALNASGGDTKGIQMAGATNISEGTVLGVQLSGATNHSKNLIGVQSAGAVNTTRNFRGVQMAGAANINTDKMKGVQMSGFWNHTGTLNGVQIGIINSAEKVEKGFSFGLINLIKEGGIRDLEASHNDVTPYNLSFKSGVPWFYAVITAGIDPHSDKLWSYGSGFGTTWQPNERLSFSLELTQHVIQPLDDKYKDGYNTDNRLAIHMGLQLAENLRLFGGPIFHYFIFDTQNAGDVAFANRIVENPIFSNASNDLIHRGWIGYEFGIRF